MRQTKKKSSLELQRDDSIRNLFSQFDAKYGYAFFFWNSFFFLVADGTKFFEKLTYSLKN